MLKSELGLEKVISLGLAALVLVAMGFFPRRCQNCLILTVEVDEVGDSRGASFGDRIAQRVDENEEIDSRIKSGLF